MVLCIVLAFCDWLSIHRQVIQTFGQCKDIEYILHYPVIVRGGQFEQLASSMKPLAMMVVAMHRHHYNKVSLSWISDEQHQKEKFLDYHVAHKSTTCSVLNEKKIKIFHSTLRSRIRKTDKGDKIQETARLVER